MLKVLRFEHILAGPGVLAMLEKLASMNVPVLIVSAGVYVLEPTENVALPRARARVAVVRAAVLFRPDAVVIAVQMALLVVGCDGCCMEPLLSV